VPARTELPLQVSVEIDAAPGGVRDWRWTVADARVCDGHPAAVHGGPAPCVPVTDLAARGTSHARPGFDPARRGREAARSGPVDAVESTPATPQPMPDVQLWIDALDGQARRRVRTTAQRTRQRRMRIALDPTVRPRPLQGGIMYQNAPRLLRRCAVTAAGPSGQAVHLWPRPPVHQGACRRSVSCCPPTWPPWRSPQFDSVVAPALACGSRPRPCASRVSASKHGQDRLCWLMRSRQSPTPWGCVAPEA
jgi:hypothetical protein